MQEHLLFHLVFLSQVFLTSFFLPKKVLSGMSFVLRTYSPSDYPKLYPKPQKFYQRVQRTYRFTNHLILILGLAVFGVLTGVDHDPGIHNAIIMGFFPVQILPLFMLDAVALRQMRLMRETSKNSARTAQLEARGVFNFVSPFLLLTAITVYVAFVVFVIYVRQFGYEWFAGYLNIAGVTIANLGFAGAAWWFMHGKRMNPHQAHSDRMKQIAVQIRVMVLTSIALTVFITIDVSLSALEYRYYLPVVLSLYFQILALISFQAYRLHNSDFEVYKDEPQVHANIGG